MGIFDKIKDVATEAVDRGQDLAKEQQLKFELRKLEGQLDEAYAAYGRRAFELHEAGTLGAGELAAEAETVRAARAAVEAKRAESESDAPAATDAAEA